MLNILYSMSLILLLILLIFIDANDVLVSISEIPELGYQLPTTFVWREGDSVNFKADIYLNQYDRHWNPIFCANNVNVWHLENEYCIGIVGPNYPYWEFLPVGSIMVISGVRGTNGKIVCTVNGIVPLESWVTISANRTATGEWILSLDEQKQEISQYIINGSPNNVLGNGLIPLLIGCDPAHGPMCFNGIIKNIEISCTNKPGNNIYIPSQ